MVQLHVLVYVGDLIVSGNDNSAIQMFKEYLSSHFHMKDFSVLKYFWVLRLHVVLREFTCANANLLWISFWKLESGARLWITLKAVLRK